MTPLLLLKVSGLLAAALLLMPLLRRSAAALRALILAAALGVAALVPLIAPILPGWGPSLPLTSLDALLQTADPAPTLRGIWLAGALLHLSVLSIGLVRLWWITLHAEPIESPAWTDLALGLSAEYHVPYPVRLICSDRPLLPVTWGYTRPAILLPAAAVDWSAERMQIVLRHEFAHIRRRDWLVQMLSSLVRAVYWFNPLVWMAAARLRRESEFACDAAVLEGGIDGREYTAHLIALARAFLRDQREWAPAPGAARRSMLEARVRAMIDPRARLAAPGRRVCAAAVAGILMLTMPLASFGAPNRFFYRPVVLLDTATTDAPTLTLLLDGRIVNLSQGVPPPRAPRASRAGIVLADNIPPNLVTP